MQQKEIDKKLEHRISVGQEIRKIKDGSQRQISEELERRRIEDWDERIRVSGFPEGRRFKYQKTSFMILQDGALVNSGDGEDKETSDTCNRRWRPARSDILEMWR